MPNPTLGARKTRTARTSPKRGRARRRERVAWWLAGVAAAAVVAGGIFLLTRTGSPPAPAGSEGAFPFPCLPYEGFQQHIHPYLQILVSGQPVSISALIGIRALPAGGFCFEPVHTHDASGIIHIESTSATQTYTLADFFAIWRATYPTVAIGGAPFPVDYTPADILGHRADAQHSVRLLVDGKPASAGPALVLNTLDYCSAAMAGPPCAPTAVADPYPPFLVQQYGTGHTIVVEYAP